MRRGRFATFDEFWPFYVGEHRDPKNRFCHYVGTSLAVGSILLAAVTVNPLWLVAAPVVGYGGAWVGHFLVERNKPATFSYPLWSLLGDFKMLGLALRGKMAEEVTRLYGSPSPSRDEPLRTAKPVTN
jgi:hypothetical protein